MSIISRVLWLLAVASRFSYPTYHLLFWNFRLSLGFVFCLSYCVVVQVCISTALKCPSFPPLPLPRASLRAVSGFTAAENQPKHCFASLCCAVLSCALLASLLSGFLCFALPCFAVLCPDLHYFALMCFVVEWICNAYIVHIMQTLCKHRTHTVFPA